MRINVLVAVIILAAVAGVGAVGGYLEGNNIGYGAGHAAGYASGHQRGYHDGDSVGYNEGHGDGYSSGLSDGETKELNEATSSCGAQYGGTSVLVFYAGLGSQAACDRLTASPGWYAYTGYYGSHTTVCWQNTGGQTVIVEDEGVSDTFGTQECQALGIH